MSNKAIAYLRVSSEEQLNGHSMDNQCEQIRMYCKVYNLELIDIVKDEGISGRKTENRPGFKKIMEMVKAKELQHVITLSFTRFARNTMDTLTAIDVMTKHDVAFHSINERIETTGAIGKFLTTFFAALSQFESDQISDRVKSVKKFCKDNGRSYATPAFGFDNVFENGENGVRKNGKIVPNEKELNVVKNMMKMAQEKIPYENIAWYLNSEGIPTKNNKKWHKSMVWYIVNNPLYKTQLAA